MKLNFNTVIRVSKDVFYKVQKYFIYSINILASYLSNLVWNSELIDPLILGFFFSFFNKSVEFIVSFL